MNRRAFHAVIGLILIICVVCPFVEFAVDWNESILTTGYDTESTIAVVALLVILALALAKMLAVCLPGFSGRHNNVGSPSPMRLARSFVLSLPYASPAVPLRI